MYIAGEANLEDVVQVREYLATSLRRHSDEILNKWTLYNTELQVGDTFVDGEGLEWVIESVGNLIASNVKTKRPGITV